MHPTSTYNQVLDYLSTYIQLQPEEVAAFLSILQPVSIDRDTILMEEGKVTHLMAFVLKGCARTYYIDENGTDKTINFHFENEMMVSLRSFFGQVPSACYTVSMEPMQLLTISHADFISYLQKFPRFEAILKDIIRDGVPDINDHVRLLQTVPAEDRYLKFIKMRPDILKRAQLKHIATYLGMNMETLSRIRAKIR